MRSTCTKVENDGGDQAEEHEHEHLAEPGVAVGPRAAGVEPPRRHGCQADQGQPPVDPDDEGQAEQRGDGERAASRRA